MLPSVEKPAQVKSPFCPLRDGSGNPVSMSQTGIGMPFCRPSVPVHGHQLARVAREGDDPAAIHVPAGAGEGEQLEAGFHVPDGRSAAVRPRRDQVLSVRARSGSAPCCRGGSHTSSAWPRSRLSSNGSSSLPVARSHRSILPSFPEEISDLLSAENCNDVTGRRVPALRA